MNRVYIKMNAQFISIAIKKYIAKPVAAGLSIFVGWKIVKTIIAITMVPATGGTSLIIAAATP